MTPAALSIVELVGRARRGEAMAFDELARRHLRAAYAVALAVVQRPSDAEDVAQEAFVVALERIERCREPARFSGWLLEIVRTRALNAIGRRKLRDPVEANEQRHGEAAAASTDILARDRLIAALAVLTVVQREVVLLHDLEGWTHAEIADATGLSEVNCRQHLFTARRALRGELANLGPREARHG